MLIITTENIQGYEIIEYLDYISETVTLGINDFKEMFQIADVIGGESTLYKKNFAKANDILKNKLKAKILELGGDALIGLRITYQEITTRGKGLLLISGTGTVVILEETEEQKNKQTKRTLAKKIESDSKALEERKKYIANILNNSFSELAELLKTNSKIRNDKELINLILNREDIKSVRNKYKDFNLASLDYVKDYKDDADIEFIIRKILKDIEKAGN